MAESAPRKSYLVVVLVIIVALVVVIAKTTTKRNAGPQPQSQTAQAPAEKPIAKTAAAVPPDSTKIGAPEPAPAADAASVSESKATAKPARTKQAAPAANAKPQPPPSPEPAPAADAASVSEPKATAKPAPTKQAARAANAKPQPPASPEPEPEPEPPTPQEPAAKEVAPLPSSKLAECLKSGRPTMADFGAGWCSPCRRMEPVLVEAATKYQGKANVVYVDTDKYANVARSYRIVSIPTQIFFDAKGEKVSQHIGYWSIEDVGRALAAAGVAE